MTQPDLLLPQGACLLHVGPYKTGTTAVQSALHAARPALTARGVVRLGERRHESLAVRAVVGERTDFEGADVAARRWAGLVGEAREAGGRRTVLSSEFFSMATPGQIDRVRTDLGSGLHAVVTLRPLSAVLASKWQQAALFDLVAPYERWLADVLDADPSGNAAARSFWRAHRHDELVARWRDAVGAAHVTVVVLDPDDPGLLMRAFEGLLGLDEGTLVAEADRANRSLTAVEVATVQAFHVQARDAGIGSAQRSEQLLGPAELYLKQRVPAPDEARIVTPEWALRRAAAIDAEIADGIRRSGVRIVGDPDQLVRPVAPGPDHAPAAEPSAEVAGRLAVGLALAAERHAASTDPEAHLRVVGGRRLLAEAARRARRRLPGTR